jgi:uncharacterized protein (DUF1684 family)
MTSVDEESTADRIALLDWKRRIFALYVQVRAAEDPVRAWERWRSERDELFATHPQSPLPPAARAGFAGLDYFPYDRALRVDAEVVPVPLAPRQIGSSGAEAIAAERFAEARFSLGGASHTLELYWLCGYGGGLFLAFRDATSGSESYGGGRYLLDTVKGSDLGSSGERLVLDFNFAYNPSCCYDPRWTCPLAPQANRLPASIWAGERIPASRS